MIGAAILLSFVLIFHKGIYKQIAGLYVRTNFPEWYQETEPIHMIGGIHYVGSLGLAAYLLPSEDGHILIDGGLPETAPMIIRNIEKLGYKPEDVKILLNTHAHSDHAGGLAELKEKTGATMIASLGDRSALEGGFYLGYEDRSELDWPPIEVDQLIEDGEKVTLGDWTLTANITPGHTRGCTSWTLSVEEAGKAYEALIFCSATVALNSLVPEQYPGIVDDYKATFARTKTWSPDIFLSNHSDFFNMKAKREKLENGDRLAFIEVGEFKTLIERLERNFEEALKEAKGSQSTHNFTLDP